MGKRKTYSKEFKLKAVNMVIEQGQSPVSVAKSLGVGPENHQLKIEQEILKKAMAFIQQERKVYPVVTLCKVLQVGTSSFEA